jgi:hypothetical protein
MESAKMENKNNSDMREDSTAASVSHAGDIKQKSVRGGMVTMVAQCAEILIHLASTVVLARLR